jgi:putative transcriptional regulator
MGSVAGRFFLKRSILAGQCEAKRRAAAPALVQMLRIKCAVPRGRIHPAMESMLDIPELAAYSTMESLLYMDPNILNRVKDLRVARGWTQEELAKATGVSRQSINSIERNRYVPSLALALTFARVFGCSTDEIFLLENKA